MLVIRIYFHPLSTSFFKNVIISDGTPTDGLSTQQVVIECSLYVYIIL